MTRSRLTAEPVGTQHVLEHPNDDFVGLRSCTVPVLRQYSIDVVSREAFLRRCPFLPFRCNKEQQTAAQSETRNSLDISWRRCPIRQRPAHCGKARLATLSAHRSSHDISRAKVGPRCHLVSVLPPVLSMTRRHPFELDERCFADVHAKDPSVTNRPDDATFSWLPWLGAFGLVAQCWALRGLCAWRRAFRCSIGAL